MKIIQDYGKLSGIDKAAAFLLTLSDEQIQKIFGLMDEDEIRELSRAMAQLGSVDSGVMETLFEDVKKQIFIAGGLVGSFENTEKLLKKILPKDRVDTIMEEIRGPAGRTMWDKLGNVNETLLANYLKNEYPQTIAVILTKIRTEHSSKVLALLPESLAMEVMLRMLRMEPVQKDIVEDIEKTLRLEFMSSLARSSKRDPHEQIAEIFNCFDRATEARFMEALEERNPESSERIKALMFTFDDIQRIDASGIQAIIRVADKAKLVLALKGANQTMKDLFLKNLSERAAKIMREDMEAMGPVKLKDVEEAQFNIVMTAKDLSAKGEIVISSGAEDDDEMIV